MAGKPDRAPRSTASRAWGIGRARQAKVVSSETLFQGRVFSLRREQIAEPSGVTAIREVIFHPGSVVVLPVLDDGRIVLIRQYRHAAGQYLWELVAGHKEPDEDPVEGAHRELQEETGYTAKRVKKLFEIYPSPGLLSERMDIFLAEGLTKGKARPEEDEKITQRIFTLREAKDWIRSGKIRDSKTIAGILYYAAFMASKR
ncbi:MAG TPA: NUDIX hydrolase [Verrucomicrobiae bacterium]|nr:NUDIX hydrolase [Verrucomicrobiae bacterium]